jgi:pimeloyl-ACP methyl ester carboxylesterase
MDKVMVETSRIRTHCFVGGPPDGVPVLLVHGNITTGRFWQGVAEGFPGGYRLVAPDLRAFGRTEPKPVDVTRGLRDWSDDLHALGEALGWAGSGRIHLAGWSNGGGVVQQHAIDHGDQLASIALVAPLSPYGFGGSRDVDGTPRGDQDQVISDESMFDFGTLGKLEVVPGWPGMDVFPPEPQIGQTRAMLDRYAAGGGPVREVVLDGCGHGPPVERAADLRDHLLAHIEGAA